MRRETGFGNHAAAPRMLLALAAPPATAAIVGSLPEDRQGVASAVNDTARDVGGALGIAVLGSVLANHVGHLGPHTNRSSSSTASRRRCTSVRPRSSSARWSCSYARRASRGTDSPSSAPLVDLTSQWNLDADDAPS